MLPAGSRPGFPGTEIGLTTEAKESTESGEVRIPLRTLDVLCVLCGSMSDSEGFRCIDLPLFAVTMCQMMNGRQFGQSGPAARLQEGGSNEA
jgi:hypothetical protein